MSPEGVRPMEKKDYSGYKTVEKQGKKVHLSEDLELNNFLVNVVESISKGDVPQNEGWALFKKGSPTGVLPVSENNLRPRHRPDTVLTTYKGATLDSSGNLILDTENDPKYGNTLLTTEHAVLRNEQPIRYPVGHKLEGQEIKGYFNYEHKFIVVENPDDPEFIKSFRSNGKELPIIETLYNEYASPTAKDLYGAHVMDPIEEPRITDNVWVMEGFRVEGRKILNLMIRATPENRLAGKSVNTGNGPMTISENGYVFLAVKLHNKGGNIVYEYVDVGPISEADTVRTYGNPIVEFKNGEQVNPNDEKIKAFILQS